MPLNRLWREMVESDTALDEQAIQEVEHAMAKTVADLAVYDTLAWKHLADMLDQEFMRQSELMMNSDDPTQVMLARDRARYVAQLKRKPQELEARLAELQSQLRVLQGEAEEE